MKKVPVSLIIDDPAPIISVYHEHAATPFTLDGRPLIPTFPNSLLFEFCDIIEKRGIKGKFSVVPMPGNKGDIVNGLEGVSQEDLNIWLNTVKERVVPQFTIGPEMLTHHLAVNLADNSAYELNEHQWSQTQDRTILTPYINKALSLLKEVGFHPVGVTSPWRFGIAVEEEYYASISKAVYDVTGSSNAWVFLRSLRGIANAKPWVARKEDGKTLVAIPATTNDRIWQTIDCTDTSEAYVHSIADLLITADGKDGEWVQVLETNSWPILITHWQSLMSNGLGTGLRVLDEVARRINDHYSHRVEWMDFQQIMNLVIANQSDFPKPEFG